MSAARFKSSTGKVHLFNLSPAPGSQHSQKRVGRGRSSGLGKTSGRGHKGQKARAGNGKPKAGFEGGQTTISKLFPKRGFFNQTGKTWAPVNLDRIAFWVLQGRLSSTPENPITARDLVESGCIHDAHDGVKILGDGAEQLKVPIHVTPSRASKSAIKAIEAAGGSVFCKYYNQVSLFDCLKGKTDRTSAAPTLRKDITWYTDWRNRGYLSPEGITKNPLVEERWKELSKQLLVFKEQEFDKPSKSTLKMASNT
ncbi:ribosomal protein L15 [Stereum hirsutum FP-91666 SS1]|uniref:ribosomal protein L15 n=1 Tax=Stereum hirsutum (strain FP-91666) TaxID=721885 RepID=UPI0004449C5B|nr:ribosomal protein L15 [Stereum hirsutum FP-91666 SS1]EIM82542.1 ribosomal protein L15 [Stereum hirsutum FP-91666 SS1]